MKRGKEGYAEDKSNVVKPLECMCVCLINAGKALIIGGINIFRKSFSFQIIALQYYLFTCCHLSTLIMPVTVGA